MEHHLPRLIRIGIGFKLTVQSNAANDALNEFDIQRELAIFIFVSLFVVRAPRQTDK